MSKEIYKIGDYVKIKNEEEGEKIGKIEDIFIEDDEKLIRYNYFIEPKCLVLEIDENYFGEYELLKTEKVEKDYYVDIICKITVINFENYMIKKMKKEIKSPIYYFRQIYSEENGIVYPDVDSLKCCGKLFNPDEDVYQCFSCKKYLHINCLSKLNNVCPNCENPIKNTSNVLNNMGINKSNTFVNQIQENSNSMLNKKRDKITNNLHNSNVLNMNKLQKSNISQGQGGKQVIGNNSKLQNITSEVNQNDDKKEYSNLPNENRDYLIKLIDSLSKISSISLKSLSSDEKIRKIIKDQLTNTMVSFFNTQLYAIEELKVRKDYTRFENSGLFDIDVTTEINEDVAKKICTSIALDIENRVFYTYNKKATDSNYKSKLRTLTFNLNIVENEELRSKVLSKEILPEKLITMSVDELAPSKLKKTRNELQSKYIKEQVIRTEALRVIAKNRKGEEIVATLGHKGEIEFTESDIVNAPKTDEFVYNKALDDDSDNDNSDEEDTYKNFENKKSKPDLSKNISTNTIDKDNNDKVDFKSNINNQKIGNISVTKTNIIEEDNDITEIVNVDKMNNENDVIMSGNNYVTKIVNSNDDEVMNENIFSDQIHNVNEEEVGNNELEELVKGFTSVADLNKYFEETLSVLKLETRNSIEKRREEISKILIM